MFVGRFRRYGRGKWGVSRGLFAGEPDKNPAFGLFFGRGFHKPMLPMAGFRNCRAGELGRRVQ